MKYLDIYEKMDLNDEDAIFNYMISNLRHSNRTFDFFVDWGKVFQKVENIEIELNILNYLIGKEDIKTEFSILIHKYPSVVTVIPMLVAIREQNIEILVNFKTPDWEYKDFSFHRKPTYTIEEVDDIVDFCDKSGLLYLFKNRKIKNLVDYCIGIEVGIGTNGRKNRSGKIMESIIEWNIDNICNKLGLQYIVQASSSKIYHEWGITLPIDKNSRQYDFAILKDEKLVLIETNFFSGGGSKLKSVAGEFISLNNFLKDSKIVDKFIWITDGIGWKTATRPLKETFSNNNFVINNRMILDGILEEIILLKEND